MRNQFATLFCFRCSGPSSKRDRPKNCGREVTFAIGLIPIPRFARALIVRQRAATHDRAVSMLPTIQLSDGDKLQALRRLDQFRKWRTLDDRRYCLCCGDLLTGHDIEIVGGTRGTGPLRAICPSERCNSIPMDWALPTDEALTQISMRTNDSVGANQPARLGRRTNSMAGSLRWLAQQFKRTA